jgi:hypothetical protein
MQSKEERMSEIQAWERQLPHGYIATADNIQLITAYINDSEGGVYTISTLNKAVNVVHTNPKWTWAQPAQVKSQAELNYEAAGQNSVLEELYAKDGDLVQDGDQRFENLTSLLAALKGYSIDQGSYQNAKQRIQQPSKLSVKHGMIYTRLHVNGQEETRKGTNGSRTNWTPADYANEAKSRTAKEVAPTDRTNWTPLDYSRDAKERADKESLTTGTEQALSEENAIFRAHAQNHCRYGNHATQSEITKVFNQSVAAGDSWRKVCDKTSALVEAYKRQAMRNDRSVR